PRRVVPAREHIAERLKHRFRISRRFSFDCLGHERGGRFRDRTPRPLRHLKTDVADRLAVELHVQLNPVTAQRIVAFRLAVGRFNALEIPRAAVVVENDLLIELAEIRHCSARRPRTIASSCARSGATSMRPRISAAKPYVSIRRASCSPTPRLWR